MDSTPENPETPLHAQANEQLNLDNVRELDEKDIEDLDLNPGFDESLPPSTVASKIHLNNMPTRDDGEIDPNFSRKRGFTNDQDDMEFSMNQSTSSPMFDNINDFKPCINVTSPFSSSSLIHDRPASISNESQATNVQRRRRLSMSQQSKFVSYVDQRFMDIQRKFVQSRGLNNKTGYQDLADLLKDVKSLLDFIWYSIDNTPNTDFLLQQEDEDELEQELEDQEKEFLHSGSTSTEDISLDLMCNSRKQTRSKSICDFGQTSYIIKIADDVMDYIEKFEIDVEDSSTISKIFKLFFILDKIFSKLISGKNNNLIKLNRTDMVRFVGIAERSRVRLPLFFEKLNIHGFHYELSKIYESSLDLCAC